MGRRREDAENRRHPAGYRLPGVTGGLQLTDGRTGSLTELRAGLIRVAVHLSGAGGHIGPADQRALLAYDILRRTAELRGGLVTAAAVLPEPRGELLTTLATTSRVLGVYPMAAVPITELVTALGGPATVELFADGAAGQLQDGVIHLYAGRTTLPEEDNLPVDPLAVRLVMLESRYQERLTCHREQLIDANMAIDRWRRRVADWAEHPSAPVPVELRQSALAALCEDLNTPAIVDLLRRTEQDSGMAHGAKFETFAYLDRVLALELTRDIGAGVPPT